MNNDKKSYLLDVVLFIAAAALYAPSLRNGFVGDDLIYFIGNPAIMAFDAATILRSGAIGADYLPLRDLSFALDYLIWGENPFGFHLTNVVLFGVAVVCVKHFFFRVTRFLSGDRLIPAETHAFLAALVFAVHPNHREVVYAVYNRGGLLNAIFFILSCLLFIGFMRGGGRRYLSYAGALVCFVLALLSREYGIILPFVLILLIQFGDRSKAQEQYMHVVPFFIVTALFYGIYKEYAVAANFIRPASESPVLELLSKTAVAAKIALFYPVRMVTSLGEFVFDDSAPFALFSLAVVAAVFSGTFRVRRRHPGILFGLFFYLICLIPVLNFFRTLPIVSPRYSFLPCIGLFFMLMSAPYQGKLKSVAGVCAVLTLIWSLSTFSKTSYWKDNISFWEPMAARDKTPYAYMQLGYAYYDAKLYEKAMDAFAKVGAEPWDAKYHRTVGDTCLRLGDFHCAARSLETALARGADDGRATLDLGKAYLGLGDRANAERCFDFVRNNFPEMREEVNRMLKSFGKGR